jgi:hypothetical protein
MGQARIESESRPAARLRRPVALVYIQRARLGLAKPPRLRLAVPSTVSTLSTITEVSGYRLLTVRAEQEEETSAQVRL